ncbi:MAG: ATP-binding cassette domain-containing protein [Burkholderiaceae bacterium]
MPNEPATAKTASPEQGELRRAAALLVRALRPDARLFAVTLFWLAVAAGFDVLAPLLGKMFIDNYLVPRRDEPGMMAALLAGALLAGLLAGGLRYLTLIRMAGIAMAAVRRLREWVYAHVLSLPIAHFDRAITGQLVSRITNDTEQIRQLYVQVLFEVLQGICLMLAAVAAMAWLDWRLMLIVLTLLPVLSGIVWAYRRLSAAAVSATRELRSEINARMAESIAGMSVLQATRATRRFGREFAGVNEAYYRSRQREIRANAFLLRPAMDLVNVMLVVGVIAAFGLRGDSVVEIGLLYAFINYVARVVEPLNQIAQQFSILQQSLVSAARVDSLLTLPGDAAGVDAHARMTDGSVRIESLSFGYRPDKPVLQDLSLQMASGGFYGIVGHTGAGKSTLLALLLRFYAPQSGTILLGGQPLGTLADQTLREDLALVPQEPFLIADTVAANIDMGRGLDRQRIEAAARQADAHGFIERLEQGYDTPLGEGGARLSAGQKQLVAIARALAGQPRILLLDEATSRVDSDTERRLARALASLRGTVTVIAIAHRLSTVRAADRLFVLSHGVLAEQGDHPALMAIDAGIYQRLYRLQRLALRNEAPPS